METGIDMNLNGVENQKYLRKKKLCFHINQTAINLL